MKKSLLLFGLLLLTLSNTYGQDTLLALGGYYPQPLCNFEDRDTSKYFHIDNTQPNNIWQIGKPSKVVFNSAYSVPLALVTDTLNTYPNGNTSSFEIVVRTDDQTFIHFWHRFNTDSLTDGGIIEVSTDGGVTWTNILNATQFTLTNFYPSTNTISSNGNKPGFTGNSGWIKSTIFGYALYFVKFRFTFTSDNINTNKDGWMIDSLNLVCYMTSVNEVKTNSKIQFFPNPTSDQFFIDANTTDKLNVDLYDVNGRHVFSKSVSDKSNINVTTLAEGVYSLTIKTADRIINKKLVIVH